MNAFLVWDDVDGNSVAWFGRAIVDNPEAGIGLGALGVSVLRGNEAKSTSCMECHLLTRDVARLVDMYLHYQSVA